MFGDPNYVLCLYQKAIVVRRVALFTNVLCPHRFDPGREPECRKIMYRL